MSSEYARPASLDEAVALRRDHPGWTVLAGGTDLYVSANQKRELEGLLDLFGLSELGGIDEGADGTLRVGAGVTYTELIESEVVARRVPILVEASREVGAPQIQNRGTIGGNIVTSSPVGDTLPVLLAADAEIELVSHRGSRRVPYQSFCTGYRQIDMAPDELVGAIWFPPAGADDHWYWRKIGTRKAQSISKVMFAGRASLSGGSITLARFAFGAVADRPIRAAAAEAAAIGKPPGAEAAAAARSALEGEIVPIDDVRSTARYRLRSAANVLARFVTSLA